MKRIVFYILLLFIIGTISFFYLYGRSESASKYLKHMLLPRISEVMSLKVDAERIYINPFPLMLGIEGLKFSSNAGVPSGSIEKIRLYISYSGLLQKVVRITRAELSTMRLTSTGQRIEKDLLGLIPMQKKAGLPALGRTKDQWQIVVDRIVFRKGDIYIKGESLSLNAEDIWGEFSLRKRTLSFGINFLTLRHRKGEFRGKTAGELSFKDGHVSVDRLFVSSEDSIVRVKGDLYTSTLRMDLDVKGKVFVERLLQWLGEEEPIRGPVTFGGIIKGPLRAPVVEFKAVMEKGFLYGVDVDEVKCKIEYKNHRMRFYEGKVKAYNGKAIAEVSINLPKVTWYELRVLAEGLDSTPLLKLMGWDPGLREGKVSGVLTSEGRRLNPKGFFSYHTPPQENPDRAIDRITDISGRFYKKGELLILDDLRIAGEGALIKSRGLVDLGKDRIYMNGTLFVEELRRVFKNTDVEGKGSIDITVGGKLSSADIYAMGKISNFRFRGRDFGSFEFKTRYRERLILITDLSGRNKNKRYSFRGLINTGTDRLFEFDDPTLSLFVDIEDFPIGYLEEIASLNAEGVDLKGRFNYKGEITGSIKNPVFRGRISTEALKADSTTIGDLQADFMLKDSLLVVKEFTLKRGISYIRGDLRIQNNHIDSGRIEFLLGEDVLSLNLPFSVRLEGSGVIKGPLKSPSIEVDAEVRAKDIEKNWVTIGSIKGNMTHLKGDFSGSFLKERVDMKGKISIKKRIIWEMVFLFKKDSYEDFLLSFSSALPEDFFLVMGGRVEVKGISGNITMITGLDTLQFTLFERTVINEGPIVFRYENNKVSIEEVKLRSGPAVLQLVGYFIPDREIEVTIYGTTYLAPFKPFFKKLEYLRGHSEFVFSITGTWDSPLINGGISLEDASLEFKGIRGRITGINGYAYVDENRLVVEEITGRFAGGSFIIKGGGRFEGISLRRYTFEFSTEKMILRPFDGLNADISAELLITESDKETLVSGDIRILRARFTRNIDWRQMLLSKKTPMVTAKNERLRSVSLSISISGEDNIIIDNNIISAPARVDLILTGTAYSPTLLGRVELLGGKVFFRNNQFTVVNASADFTEPTEINPYIDITAITSVKGYNITLNLNGYIDEFNLSLSSEPSLDEVDILSLLTVGSLSSGVKGLEGGIGASEATMFITGKLQETLQERLRSLTGFDRIELEPSVIETTGTLGPRVTVYKRLLSDRLYVTYTTTIGAETEQLLRVEFQLSNKVSLVGERDELGLIGGDIKFRLEFR